MENFLHYTFNNEDLLKNALTHSSYANEHKVSGVKDNERLEFLGDAVVEFVVSEFIYKTFPYLAEGDMTKLRASCVCERSLAYLAEKLYIDKYIILGNGLELKELRNKDSIVSDAFEAIVAAIFLDGGIEQAKKFILDNIVDLIYEKKDTIKFFDSKTYLQEHFQKTSRIPLVYEIIDESGPAHEKVFSSSVSHNGKFLAQGTGKSKKESEQDAAKNAIIKLNI